jgi:HEAT repeat protein
MVRGGEEDPALKTALEVIREERDPEVRKAALAVLVDVDLAASRPALAALVEATKDADPVVRTQAVQVLHQHALKFEPPEGLVQALEGALDDETVAANRAGILTALRDLGDEGTLRVLDAYAGTVPGRSDARLVEAARDGIRDRVGLER